MRFFPLIAIFNVLFVLANPGWADDSMPVFHKNDIILFQGDSITDGGRQRVGNDYNHTMGQDYGYIISAQLGAQFPERNLTFINRGESGDSIRDLATRWKTDTLDLKPNLLSILIGVNDTVFKNVPVEEYENTYSKLLSDTMAALPGIKIVLAEPFLLPVGSWKDGYAAHMVEIKKRQDAVHRLAVKYHLPIIEYQKAFDAACLLAPADHWSWDGVHPAYAGHGLMVREWLRTVTEFWPNG